MKKTLAILLALALMFTFAACGNDTAGTEAATGFKAGTYTETVEGHNGPITLDVVIGEDGKIASVTPTEHSETAGLGDTAMTTTIDSIVKANGTEGVETVSGATVSSQAVIDAVNAALEKAK